MNSNHLNKDLENQIDVRVELELDGEISKNIGAYDYAFEKRKQEILEKEYYIK